LVAGMKKPFQEQVLERFLSSFDKDKRRLKA